MQLTRKVQNVLETDNRSLQKVFSRLIRDISEVSPSLGKFESSKKKHEWTQKVMLGQKTKFICLGNNFLQDSIKFRFHRPCEMIWTKALHRDRLESNNGHSIILSLNKNAVIVRSNKGPDWMSSANNFAVSFLLKDRLLRTFLLLWEIKRCKCSLITFFPARFVSFHRF